MTSFSMRKILILDVKKHISIVKYQAGVPKIVSNLGGIAIFIPLFTINAIINHWLNNSFLPVILAVASLAFFIGLRDDLVQWRRHRITLVKIICILLVIYLGKFKISCLNGLFGIYSLSPLVAYIAAGLLVMLLVEFAESLNKITGLLPIIAGYSFLIFGSAFALIKINALATLCFGLTGSLIGFITFQKQHHKLTLGKAGSLLIGILLGYMSISLLCANRITSSFSSGASYNDILNIPLSISFVLLPLFDIIRRILCTFVTRTRWNHNLPIPVILSRYGYKDGKIALLIGSINVILMLMIGYLRYLNLGLNIIFCLLASFCTLIMWLLFTIFPGEALDTLKQNKMS